MFINDESVTRWEGRRQRLGLIMSEYDPITTSRCAWLPWLFPADITCPGRPYFFFERYSLDVLSMTCRLSSRRYFFFSDLIARALPVICLPRLYVSCFIDSIFFSSLKNETNESSRTNVFRCLFRAIITAMRNSPFSSVLLILNTAISLSRYPLI